MIVSLPLGVTSEEQHWENKKGMFNKRKNATYFSFLEKTVQNYLCRFHCCYKFSARTGAVYFSDLGCHLLFGCEDFGITSKSMGDKAFTRAALEMCNSLFPTI